MWAIIRLFLRSWKWYRAAVKKSDSWSNCWAKTGASDWRRWPKLFTKGSTCSIKRSRYGRRMVIHNRGEATDAVRHVMGEVFRQKYIYCSAYYPSLKPCENGFSKVKRYIQERERWYSRICAWPFTLDQWSIYVLHGRWTWRTNCYERLCNLSRQQWTPQLFVCVIVSAINPIYIENFA